MQKFACLVNEAGLIQSTDRLVSATLFLLVIICVLCLGNFSVHPPSRLRGSDELLRKLGSF